MRILSFFFLFFIIISTQAQQVKVVERGSEFPIENVAIYNDANNAIVYTNKMGIADVSKFNNSDIISFNHLSYIEYEILKKGF